MALVDLSRQRIDYTEKPNGDTVATLTVTLGDGSVHRYEGTSTAREVDQLAKVIANAEMRAMKISGAIEGWDDAQISGMFGSIFKAVKSVGKIARKIASSKAFKWAGKGLVAIAPALGPFAPAALAVGGGMMVASKLSDASIAAEAGAKRVSKMLTGGARRYARASARSVPRSARRGRRGFGGGWMRSLLNWGNSRRKGMMARAMGRTYRAAPRPRKRVRLTAAYWARKRAMQAVRRRAAAVARRPRPVYPRYASSAYPMPRYTPPWASYQRSLPNRWHGRHA